MKVYIPTRSDGECCETIGSIVFDRKEEAYNAMMTDALSISAMHARFNEEEPNWQFRTEVTVADDCIYIGTEDVHTYSYSVREYTLARTNS